MIFDFFQFQEWGSMLFSVVGAIVTFASAVVKITPSQTDDALLSKVIEVFDYFSVVNPNGTTTVSNDDLSE